MTFTCWKKPQKKVLRELKLKLRNKKLPTDSKNSEGKKEKLMAELNELKAKHDNLTTEHREEEQTLRRVIMINVR